MESLPIRPLKDMLLVLLPHPFILGEMYNPSTLPCYTGQSVFRISLGYMRNQCDSVLEFLINLAVS